MKKIIKALCPPFLWEGAKKAVSWMRQMTARDERVEILRKRFQELNDQLPADTIVIRPGVKIRIHPDSRIAFEFFCYRCAVSAGELECFARMTEGKERFLDIGALHGIFSLVFAARSPSRRVIAVDASPIAFARLLYNIHRNRFDNITAVECAVSQGEGKLKMHYEWEHAVAAGTSEGKMIEVEMVSGDTICASRAFLPDVIKIDVEGHEIKVLKGLKATIQKSLPLIFLEVHPERITQEGDSIQFIEDYFRELKYTARRVDGTDFPFSMLKGCRQDERLVLCHTSALDEGGLKA